MEDSVCGKAASVMSAKAQVRRVRFTFCVIIRFDYGTKILQSHQLQNEFLGEVDKRRGEMDGRRVASWLKASYF
jgi:hypothetical protein